MKNLKKLSTTTTLSSIETITGNTSPDTISLPSISEETSLPLLTGPDMITLDMIKEPETTMGEPDNNPPQTEPEPKKELRTIELQTNNGTMTIIHPDDLGPDTNKTPISKRGSELLLIQFTDFRIQGIHPNMNKTLPKNYPKWMIQHRRPHDQQERWIDLPKERGWNLKEGYSILTRTQTNYKNLQDMIIGRIEEYTKPTE